MKKDKYQLSVFETIFRILGILIFFVYFLFTSENIKEGIIFIIGFIFVFDSIFRLERQAMKLRGELK